MPGAHRSMDARTHERKRLVSSLLDHTEAECQWNEMAVYINTQFQILTLSIEVERWDDAEQRARDLGQYIKTLQAWNELSVPAPLRAQVRQQLNIASLETHKLVRVVLLRPVKECEIVSEEIVSEPILVNPEPLPLIWRISAATIIGITTITLLRIGV